MTLFKSAKVNSKDLLLPVLVARWQIRSRKINIQQCDNYHELLDNQSVVTESRMVKQRTQLWQDIRKKAKITGSTFFKANWA